MKILKFGGSCLKNGEDFRQAALIINNSHPFPVVILSAAYGVTDDLHLSLDKALQSEKSISGIIQSLKNRHEKIAESAIQKNKKRTRLNEEMEGQIKRLEKVLRGISYTGEITPSLRAFVLSFGERLAVQILAAYINASGRKAVALEADTIGIVTDECFEQATARQADIRNNLKYSVKPLIDKEFIPVITGYFGRSIHGKITTFGRNGTDYSAAVIASALDASALEIWKDVRGFMSADPQSIPDSKPIENLSYEEAAELSYFGAQILHPRTVEPLAQNNIPVFIKDFWNPSASGTKIESSAYKSGQTVKSVTCNKNISVLKIQGAGVGCKPGIIAIVGSALSESGINIYSIITSQTCINLIVDKKDASQGYNKLSSLCEGVIEKVGRINDLSLIAVVGEGLRSRYGVAARVLSAVAGRKINVEMISSGASEVAHYILVKTKNADAAVKAIHEQFFQSPDTFYSSESMMRPG